MIQRSRFLPPFKKLILKSFSLFLLFATTGCTDSLSKEYPNLGDVGERPSFPSVEQIEQEKKELIRTQESLQQDRRTFPEHVT